MKYSTKEKPAVSWEGMFILSKLGQNSPEMHVRTFVRKKNVTWGQLLATNAKIGGFHMTSLKFKLQNY